MAIKFLQQKSNSFLSFCDIYHTLSSDIYINYLNWDVWLYIILGVSVKVFLDKINICIARLNKADCPP